MAVIDFSKWNDMPDWQRRGFKSREESWEGFARHCRDYCILTDAQLREQQERVREINRAARTN